MQRVGEYPVEHVLGQGGQGQVLCVLDPRILGKRWALKLFKDPQLFEQEYQALKNLDRLHHPALPRVANAFTWNTQQALVITYFAGKNLEQFKPGWRRTLQILLELSSLLTQMHQAGWLYLDLKPANLIQGSDGQLHLIDYGLAQSRQSALSKGLGSPGFAPPEQMTSGNLLTPSADAYALGALGYCLLTGQTPNPSGLPPLTDIPVALEETLKALLQINPQHRLPLEQFKQLSLESLEHSLLRCPRCAQETRSGTLVCSRCGGRLGNPQSLPTIPPVQRVLPQSTIRAPGGNTQLVLNELSNPSRVRDLEVRSLRLQIEEVAQIRGFDTLQAPPRLRHLITLYPHQLDTAARALQEMRGNAILADEVGLGKTIEAGVVIKELVLRHLVRQALVLVSSHLVDQWTAEMVEKFDLPFEPYQGPADWSKPFLVASLHALQRNKAAVQQRESPYDLIVVDEMHNLLKKNAEPKVVYEVIASLPRNYMLLLSATPIRRQTQELYHLVSLIRPGHFRSLAEFQSRFATEKSRAVNTHELRASLQEVMIRHHRNNLPPQDLPPARQVEARELIQHPEEVRLLEVALKEIRAKRLPATAHTFSQVFSSPASLIQLLARHSHHVAPVGVCNKLLEVLHILQQVQRQTIVFTREASTAQWLGQHLRNHGYAVTLFMAGLTRTEKAQRFYSYKREPKGVLVATDAAAEGRNLQFAHHLINFDIPWNPLRLEQRIGRIDRLGQRNPPCIYNLYYSDAFEGEVYRLFNQGLRMFDLIVGELVSVLEELEGYGDKALDEVIAELWAKHPEPQGLSQAMSGLAAKLRSARHEFDQEKHFEDSIDRELF